MNNKVEIRIMNQDGKMIKEDTINFADEPTVFQMAAFMSRNLPIFDSYIEVEYFDGTTTMIDTWRNGLFINSSAKVWA